MSSVSGEEEICIRAQCNFRERQIAWIGQVLRINRVRGNMNATQPNVVHKCVNIALGEPKDGPAEDLNVLIDDSIIKSHLHIGRYYLIDNPRRWPKRSQEA